MAPMAFEVLDDVSVAIVGASVSVEIDGDTESGQASFAFQRGQLVKIGVPAQGARVYLSARGGWHGEPTKGAALRSLGGIVRTGRLYGDPTSIRRRDVRVVSSHRSMDGIVAAVENRSNRAGIRLSGPWLDPGEERLSEPACVGAIQVTNEGSLIVLGPDGPTIGGYRKVGVVCGADLDALGQFRPGDPLTFRLVNRDEAVALALKAEKALEAKLVQLRLAALA